MNHLLLLLLSLSLYGLDYIKDIKPILDKRCVTCHSCYNSPCQLKLSSSDGVDRGASKDIVYLGERLNAQDPTRLFIDAKSTDEWRDKGFFSVTESKNQSSIMSRLLDQKKKNPKSSGEYKSEEDLTCAKNTKELEEFLLKHPNQGMPYGFPALKDNEYKIIQTWLDEGAKTKIQKKTKLLDQVKEFEIFLNKNDAKHIMSARYIYEHLFLAHLSFEEKPDEFYELVRSSTDYPKEIDIIPSLRPYDDPNVDKFYYRFKKINSTIVYKTHMLYKLGPKKLERYKELFIKPTWTRKPYVVGYTRINPAEPFRVFEQIPAISRYKFLLDNHEYVIRTFIRGPVCKGQIALNVIHDHFWLTFMKPEYDLSLQDNGFLKSQYKNLVMPIQEGSDFSPLDVVNADYDEKATSYYINRQKLYDRVYKQGLDEDSITKDVLTIYRHFDSATVLSGAMGNLPRTAWVIDYPLFERIYYALVAGFDIFGNVGHQLSVREYMNRLRIEGESYFVNLLPLEDRDKIFRSWYKESNILKYIYMDSIKENEVYLSKVETKKRYTKQDSKREFFESFVKKFDEINYFHTDERVPKNGFRSLTKQGTAFIRHVNGIGSNLAYIRIKNIPNEKDKVYSAVVNRWHDNVMFLFSEEDRLDATKDKIDFIEGFVGSYPNLFLVLDYKDMDDFINMMNSYDGSKSYIDKFMKYGIFRGDDDFWEYFDWFQNRFYEEKPYEAGLFDLNRYYSKVIN